MVDPRTSKLADILVNYSLEVKPGEWVVVLGHMVTLPLLREVHEAVLLAGGNPSPIINDDHFSETRLQIGNEEQLQWIDPFQELAFEKADALITLMGSSNTRALSGIDPQKQQMSSAAQLPMRKIFMKRRAAEETRWVGTAYPCPSLAQEADMSLRDYEDFVYGATYADQEDPVGCWRQIHDEQQKLVDWLAGKKEVVVKGPSVDLTLSIEGRTFINSDGKVNMPSGEVFTSPVEDSANGWIRFSYPAIYRGREVEDVELEFKDGKAVSAKAVKNEEYLNTMLDVDEGGRFLGEFAVGTNEGIQRFTKNMLYDEKMGGTIHLAMGSGFPEAGSKNESAIHWDMLCNMREDSTIHVDGELFYKNGQFQV